jgi:hypothetical protein
MRQVGDTLVWLALIAVVAAVLYITPLVASYVSSRERETLYQDHGGVAWSPADPQAEMAE